MKYMIGLPILGLIVASLVASAAGAGQPRPADGQSGALHVTKACPTSTMQGQAGGYCTIVSANIPQIPTNSTVTYDQAAGIPAGQLDSNVVLNDGQGSRALGRCNLNLSTGTGICTFSDGTGNFAGFHARVNVSAIDSVNYKWDGYYSFEDDLLD